MKFVDIVKEEVKKAIPTIGEEALEALVDTFSNKIVVRGALEADEPLAKGICAAAIPVLAALKPVIDGLTDLDKDGK